jgi:hypothetical protein
MQIYYNVILQLSLLTINLHNSIVVQWMQMECAHIYAFCLRKYAVIIVRDLSGGSRLIVM